MQRSANPNRPIVFEHSSAKANPFSVEGEFLLWGQGLIPFPFVNAHLLSGMAGNAAARKKIWRIGENHVHGFFRNPLQDIEAVTLIKRRRVCLEENLSSHSS